MFAFGQCICSLFCSLSLSLSKTFLHVVLVASKLRLLVLLSDLWFVECGGIGKCISVPVSTYQEEDLQAQARDMSEWLRDAAVRLDDAVGQVTAGGPAAPCWMFPVWTPSIRWRSRNRTISAENYESYYASALSALTAWVCEC
uniref:Putative secreted peptide n=1 Tax=Anopheles braziliensis TaxID=58242 RepID=A0A2M3ZNL0_9DIPT